jgi:hypothetical protein
VMDRATVRAIARLGGAAHARGTAHRYTSEEARIAGSKGGRAPHKTRGRVHPPKESASSNNGAASEANPALAGRPAGHHAYHRGTTEGELQLG